MSDNVISIKPYICNLIEEPHKERALISNKKRLSKPVQFSEVIGQMQGNETPQIRVLLNCLCTF